MLGSVYYTATVSRGTLLLAVLGAIVLVFAVAGTVAWFQVRGWGRDVYDWSKEPAFSDESQPAPRLTEVLYGEGRAQAALYGSPDSNVTRVPERRPAA